MVKKIVPIVEGYKEEEEFLYSNSYLFIKGYAFARDMNYTLKALPLARIIHDGQYRKETVEVGENKYQLPYISHCLNVCSTLISLIHNIHLPNEEMDILCSIAIMHDVIEDGEEYFPKGGVELVLDYGFPDEVYSSIKLLSKHSGADEYELNNYFNEIKKNRNALLVKLADRSDNVKDLYNMKPEKIQKYINETRQYIYALAKYGKNHYPEFSNAITVLKRMIVSLTEATAVEEEIFRKKLSEYDKVVKKQEQEIKDLKAKLKEYE